MSTGMMNAERFTHYSLTRPVVHAIIVAALFLAGVLFFNLLPEDATIVKRYLDNSLCRVIIYVFLIGFVYAVLQLVGLKIDRYHIKAVLGENDNTPPPFYRTVCYLAGRASMPDKNFKPSNQAEPQRQETDTGNFDDETIAVCEKFEEIMIPLNFGIWVMPIMGFIGTVIGITDAIGGIGPLMSNAGAGAAANSGAMAPVLEGLTFAFDTTLIGLVLVVPTMLMNIFLRIDMARLNTLYDSLSERLPANDREMK